MEDHRWFIVVFEQELRNDIDDNGDYNETEDGGKEQYDKTFVLNVWQSRPC